jgi:hypothetical protein
MMVEGSGTGLDVLYVTVRSVEKSERLASLIGPVMLPNDSCMLKLTDSPYTLNKFNTEGSVIVIIAVDENEGNTDVKCNPDPSGLSPTYVKEYGCSYEYKNWIGLIGALLIVHLKVPEIVWAGPEIP